MAGVVPLEHRLRYTLTRLHGEGGLGRVYVAHDNDLNRDVALKEIRPDRAEHPEAWQRFLKEAQLTGQLEHPNIVPVYEVARRDEDKQPEESLSDTRMKDADLIFHHGNSKTAQNSLQNHTYNREHTQCANPTPLFA